MNRYGTDAVTSCTGRVLFEGSAEGSFLPLSAPISFWGGIDPKNGVVCDPRHPDSGQEITDRVLFVPEPIGSSSSSAILLELLRLGIAPAALLLGTCDAILVLGVLIAKELGYRTIPVIEQVDCEFFQIPAGSTVQVSTDGSVTWVDKSSTRGK